MESKLTIRKASEINLSGLISNPEIKTLMVTSPSENTGVTSSILSLAEELSKTVNDPVLIIDASTHDNTLTLALNMHNELGLTDIDTNNPEGFTPEKHYINSSRKNLYVMPSGTDTQNLTNIIHKDLKEILAVLKNKFRFIIIDTDAVYSNSNAIEIASKTNGVILVIQAEDTRWEVAQAAQKRLNQADANIIGCIFNNRKYYTPSWIYNKL